MMGAMLPGLRGGSTDQLRCDQAPDWPGLPRRWTINSTDESVRLLAKEIFIRLVSQALATPGHVLDPAAAGKAANDAASAYIRGGVSKISAPVTNPK